jgi:hypothetical protein
LFAEPLLHYLHAKISIAVEEEELSLIRLRQKGKKEKITPKTKEDKGQANTKD